MEEIKTLFYKISTTDSHLRFILNIGASIRFLSWSDVFVIRLLNQFIPLRRMFSLVNSTCQLLNQKFLIEMRFNADKRLLRVELAPTLFKIKLNTWSIDFFLFPSSSSNGIISIEFSLVC